MAKKPHETEVENYAHRSAKRLNIPTAENQALVPDDEKALKVLRYPRNPDLDPQLVWRGKDAEDDGPLEVDAPPIYIQEKIHPRQLIADLRKQSAQRREERAEQIDLFQDFNGLPKGWVEDAAASYYHDEGRWQNRMILGDSLLVMASLAGREALRGKVQCIYFDPPYGIKFNSNWQPSTKSRDVKDGKEESVSREPEVVKAFRDTWKDGINSYLSYLRDRLTVARDLLSETGSVFVQIGDENLHLVRTLMDEVFGAENLVANITVQKAGSTFARYIGSVADYVIWYCKDVDAVKYHENYQARGDTGADLSRFTQVELPDGTRTSRAKLPKLPIASRLFAPDPLESAGMGRQKGEGAASWFPVELEGRTFKPTEQTRWKTNQQGMERLKKAGRLLPQATRIRFLKYVDDFPFSSMTNIWSDLAGAADKVYVVQTNSTIVERCILMTTDPGDLVVDPTCGSGTTAYVAEQWGRRWITIDTSRVALTLARARLMGAKYDYYLLADSEAGAAEDGKLTGKPPAEGPFKNDIRHGFVYERAPHVMLKSIASNAEIDVIWDRYQPKLEHLRVRLNKALGERWDDWQIPGDADIKWPEAPRVDHAAWWELRRERQKEIDASIARNADVELLYDRPLKAKGVVRVAGPFTVESLSPHRVLPLEEDPFLAELLDEDGAFPSPVRERGRGEGTVGGEDPHPAASPPPSPEREKGIATDFAQVVYDNLLASGVQNTKKGEAIKFEWLKPRVSPLGPCALRRPIHAERRAQARGDLHRAGI